MRCQDIERLILEKNEQERTSAERRALEAHLEGCPECSAFRDFRESLRSALRDRPLPQLNLSLVERTRALCHSELNLPSVKRPTAVPWSIWAAFGVLTAITLGFFIPQILDFFATREFTTAMGLTLVILLQNAVMLFFAPIIIRRQHVGHNGWRECR